MSQKKRCLAVLICVLGVLLFAGACKAKKVAAPPPPPPPPPPPAPTVTLTAEPSTINKGDSVTLSWTSQNATSLDLQPAVGTVQAQGSTSVTPSESTTYTITATGPGGTNSQSARVTVTLPPPPPPPPPPPVKEVSEDELFEKTVKDAYFDYDKADIRPDAQQVLTGDGNFLKEHQGIKFTVEGNCDERGSEEYNLGLGDKRANAAKAFLGNLGVSGDRISTISFGKSKAAHCTADDCWQQDRHDHFKIGTESK